MQFLSAGKRSLREKPHACDAGPQAADGGLPVAGGLVDRLHRQAYALLLLEGLPRLRAIHDPAEARVLTWDADAGVEHDGGQKPSLTLGEAFLCDGVDASRGGGLAAASN